MWNKPRPNEPGKSASRLFAALAGAKPIVDEASFQDGLQQAILQQAVFCIHSEQNEIYVQTFDESVTEGKAARRLYVNFGLADDIYLIVVPETKGGLNLAVGKNGFCKQLETLLDRRLRPKKPGRKKNRQGVSNIEKAEETG